MKRRIWMSTAQETDSTGSAADGIAGRAGSRRLAALLLVLFAAIAGAPAARAQAKADPEAIAARIGALTKGHVYDGSIHARSEVIRAVEPEGANLDLLVLRIDDAKETAPLTVVVPLREIAQIESSTGGIYLSCRGPVVSANCVIVTDRSFAVLLPDLMARTPLAAPHKRRGGFLIGCAPQNCREVLRSVAALQREANARK